MSKENAKYIDWQEFSKIYISLNRISWILSINQKLAIDWRSRWLIDWQSRWLIDILDMKIFQTRTLQSLSCTHSTKVSRAWSRPIATPELLKAPISDRGEKSPSIHLFFLLFLHLQEVPVPLSEINLSSRKIQCTDIPVEITAKASQENNSNPNFERESIKWREIYGVWEKKKETWRTTKYIGY